MAMACGSHPAQSPGSQRARRLCGSALYNGHARGQGTSAGGRTTSREAAGPRPGRGSSVLAGGWARTSLRPQDTCAHALTHTHTMVHLPRLDGLCVSSFGHPQTSPLSVLEPR